MAPPSPRFDLIVLGGGPAGYVAAIRAAQLGMKTAVVEEHPQLGGTCLRVGCIPSKALLESSERFAQVQHGLAEHGVVVDGVRLDLPAMHRRKRQIVATLAAGVAALLKQHQIERIEGRGRLDGPRRVHVSGEMQRTLEGDRVLIAVGSRPAELPGVRRDGELIGTSTEALAYSHPPGHLVVVGAGYIGLELGSVWRRLGSQVTVLEALDRILPGLDLETAAAAQRLFVRQGLEFRLGVRVDRMVCEGERCTVRLAEGPPIECDRVLLAVGRVANTQNLGLETAGITTSAGGEIVVNERFETSASGVFAIGDCIRGPKLAHKAAHEAVACVDMMAGLPGHINYETIPGVVYTHPEIAAVGKTEEQLQEARHPYRKGVFPFLASGRARTLGETAGQVKILADAATDRILGVHILGPRAGDLIAEAAAAMEFGASAEDLAAVCHAHPTLSEALGEAALAIGGKAIHLPPRGR